MSLAFGHLEQVLELLDLLVNRGSFGFDLPADQTCVLIWSSTALHNLIHRLLRAVTQVVFRPLTGHLVAIFRWTISFGDVLNPLSLVLAPEG